MATVPWSKLRPGTKILEVYTEEGLQRSYLVPNKTLGNKMTDKINAETPMAITDVKHFVVTKDADGNEVRTEVTEEQVKKDFSEVI